jgi:branched-chain amino acid transport system substrate-binding protein
MQVKLFRKARHLALAGVLTCGAIASVAASASASGSKAAPIYVGSVLSKTGVFGTGDGPAAYGLEAWAKAVNAQGGINGHKVILSIKDDQGSPSVSISATRAFAQNPKILALLGNSSGAEGSFFPLAAALKLPIVGGIQYTPADYTTKYYFPIGTDFPAVLWGEVYASVHTAHAKKIALMYCAEESACALATPAVQAAATEEGASLVNSQAVPATAPNYDAQCTAAKNAGATAIVAALGSSTLGPLAQSCASIGYHPVITAQTTSLTPQQPAVSALSGMIGIVGTFPWVATDTPAAKAFQAAVKAAKVPASQMSDAVTVGYVSGVEFQTAVESIKGAITRASVAKALWHLKQGETLGGLTGPLHMKPNSASPQQKCFFVMQVKNGAWKAPYGSKAFCQK